MATVTEQVLLRQCVEKPQTLNVRDLNLEKIADPVEQDLSEDAIIQKKGLKMVHMAWSAILKYIRSHCTSANPKPVEVPHFGIFIPIPPENVGQKLTSEALKKIQSDVEIRFLVSQGFLNLCGGIRCSENSAQIQSYDPVDIENTNFRASIQHINLAAIAKVCDTDVISVEQIMREIVAQIKEFLKNG